MKMPSNIEFKGDSKTVLLKSLLAVAPEEGCALLLGKIKKHKLSKPKKNCLRNLFNMALS